MLRLLAKEPSLSIRVLLTNGYDKKLAPRLRPQYLQYTAEVFSRPILLHYCTKLRCTAVLTPKYAIFHSPECPVLLCDPTPEMLLSCHYASKVFIPWLCSNLLEPYGNVDAWYAPLFLSKHLFQPFGHADLRLYIESCLLGETVGNRMRNRCCCRLNDR